MRWTRLILQGANRAYRITWLPLQAAQAHAPPVAAHRLAPRAPKRLGLPHIHPAAMPLESLDSQSNDWRIQRQRCVTAVGVISSHFDETVHLLV
jgi:hypothetical protein